MSNKTHKSCLLLNIDYTPVSIIDWQKSICWYFKIQQQNYPSVEILSYHNEYIIGLNNQYQLPSVIKSNIYIKTQRKYVKFTRHNLFLRDNYTCQYCGKQYGKVKLTYDHVIPKSKWLHTKSPTCWHNIVTACYRCNRKKSNRTPEEAGMPLINKPKMPSYHHKYLPWFHHLSNMEYVQEWKPYISMDKLNENQYQRL